VIAAILPRALSLLALLACLLSSTALHATPPRFGVTLITHGYQVTPGRPEWLISMAEAVFMRNGARIPIYVVKVTKNLDTGDLDATYERLEGPLLNIEDVASLIVIIDWSEVACFDVQPKCPDEAPTSIVGERVWATLQQDPQTMTLLTQTSVHLIAHSRGSGVISKLAYKLGERGIWVDHLTFLDPQPVTSFGDFPSKAWENVVYAEDYWEVIPPYFPWGEDVHGSFDPNLSLLLLCPSPCLDPTTHHSEVHAYYHGTIDAGASSDGAGIEIPGRWYESGGFAARSATGYVFSRAGQPQGWPGTRPSKGIHQGFPGGAEGNRTDPISPPFPFGISYPNILLRTLAPNAAMVGQTISIPYIVQSQLSPHTVTLELDDDTNPFNGSGSCATASPVVKEVLFSPIAGWDALHQCNSGPNCEFALPSVAAAACYVRATVRNTDNELTRYDYTITPLTIGIPPPATPVASFEIPQNYATNQHDERILGVVGASGLTVTTSGMLSPSLSLGGCNGGDQGDYIEIRDQTGAVIRRLNGAWNQTFDVAGSWIRVLFHSNCYTYPDAWVGPAIVSVVASGGSPRDFEVPTNYGIGSDYEQVLSVPGARNLAITTSGRLSPSLWNCGSADTGDYIEILDKTGTMIRRLNGSWSQAFNVSGDSIRVRFHSNCYTYPDSWIGPANVHIAATDDPARNFAVPLNYGIGSDYEQTLGVPGAPGLVITTSGRLSPSLWNCGSGDVGDYIEIRDIAGKVIRRLNGTWDQTFNVAGSAVRVTFHSNCYTYPDSWTGPASVSVAASSEPPRNFGVPANYGISSDYEQTLTVPGAQALSVSTSGALSSSLWNCGSADVGDYIEIRDKDEKTIRRLNGTWDQTFNVAGDLVHVLFHSNCYTYPDSWIGPATVNVVATTGSPRDFGVATNYGISSDYQQTLFVPGAETLTVTTSGKLSPNLLGNCGGSDTGDYIEIRDQTGAVTRRLSGDWNQTFGVAGPWIRVLFHSNCYTYPDALVGPAAVSIAAQTVGSSDSVPDALVFASSKGAAPGALVESSPVVVAGINTPTTISAANGFYRVNGGALTTLAGTLNPGDSVVAVGIAPALPGKTGVTTITVGGISGTFGVTTRYRRAADFSGNGQSDIAWRNSATGALAIWLTNASAIGTAFYGVPPDWELIGTGDFDGDGRADVLWRRPATGETAIWFMNGGSVSASSFFAVPLDWDVSAIADVDGDGKEDLLWRRTSNGDVAIWFMNGAAALGTAFFNVPTDWALEEASDFDGDGKSDLLWRRTSDGALALWFMNGATRTSVAFYSVPSEWTVAGTGDLDGNGKAEILWRRGGSGDLAIWFMNGAARETSAFFNVPPVWSLINSGDFDGDGNGDLLWRNASDGTLAIWYMNGTSRAATAFYGVPKEWAVVAP
jgi:hypothetical protein